jgi:serine/threonine protein phosphatase PrpC
MIELDIAEAETIGTRAEQQDAAAIVRLGRTGDAALLILADGLGGHADGAKAARIVVDTFLERASCGAFDQLESCRGALDDTIHEANARIRGASDPADGERSMASTAIAAVIGEGHLDWISVGDSHLYVWRHGQLAKLNADHSQAGMMIRDGLAPDAPAVLAAQSMLASALGGHTIEHIDRPDAPVALAAGDVIVLASDGLDVLSDADIARIVGESVDRGIAPAQALVAAVQALGLSRQDNATVVAARVLGTGAPANADDPLPPGVIRPAPDSSPSETGSPWPLLVGLALLAVVLLSVIVTQKL